ncbi:AMP-binding protein [Microbacterium sp.]|uniref:AMP-binding protein n=1 Tax=Microbacterium sp. TaxID=51671 RepID=UPI003A8CCB85
MSANADTAPAAAPTLPPSFTATLKALADADPDRPAITDPSGTLTRGELAAASNRLARAYAALGVREGDFVSIGLPNSAEFLVSSVAVWKLGATPQPLSHRLPARELAAIIATVRPALVVGLDAGDAAPSVPAGFAPDGAFSTDDLPERVAAEWKAPTSGGSTGVPKVIVCTQPARVDAVLPLAGLLRLTGPVTTLIPSPLSHNAGFLWATATLLLGGHAVIMPRFDATTFRSLVAEHDVQWIPVVPTMLHRVAKLPDDERAAADLSRVQTIATGAAPCPQWLKEFWVDWVGPERMLEYYAPTEAQLATFTDGAGWLSHPDSVGRVVLGEIEVRSPEGEVVPDGVIGELWVRRNAQTPGPYRYIGAEPHRDDRGFDTVGDMGRLEDGWLYLADRTSDMVVVGGANVYPAEVEGALDEHPHVLSSCVVGLPDDEYGSVLHAIVQLEAPVTDDELRTHLRERVAPYKVPRTFERSNVPLRDDAGKVRRVAQRERVLAERAAGTNRSPR